MTKAKKSGGIKREKKSIPQSNQIKPKYSVLELFNHTNLFYEEVVMMLTLFSFGLIQRFCGCFASFHSSQYKPNLIFNPENLSRIFLASFVLLLGLVKYCTSSAHI